MNHDADAKGLPPSILPAAVAKPEGNQRVQPHLMATEQRGDEVLLDCWWSARFRGVRVG